MAWSHLRRTPVIRQEERFRRDLLSYDGYELDSRLGYLTVITVCIVGGLVWTALISHVTIGWEFPTVWSYVFFALGAFAVALVGIPISVCAESPLGALFGFAIMATGLGALLGPTLALYASGDIVRAMAATAVWAILFAVLGQAIPVNLSGVWPFLMWATSLIIAGLVTVPLLQWLGIPTNGAMQVIDWAILAVFSAWVAVDMNVAMRACVTRTATPLTPLWQSTSTC